MKRWEIELWDRSLLVKFILVLYLHVFEDWTCYTDHELGHLKSLLRTRFWNELVALWINLLCYSIEMTKEDPTLGEAQNSIKRTLWSLQNVHQIIDSLFQASHNIW